MLLPEHLNNDNGDFKVILMFTSLVLTEKLLGEVVYQSSCVMQNIHLERVQISGVGLSIFLTTTTFLLDPRPKEDPIKLLLSVCPSARPSVRNFSDNGPLFF